MGHHDLWVSPVHAIAISQMRVMIPESQSRFVISELSAVDKKQETPAVPGFSTIITRNSCLK
jgi:hypothetical protein